MESTYKKIGDFVTKITEKNKEGLFDEVLGISIDKEFMPSVANTIGTDLKKYNVVRKNRFAFNPMHVGRDNKIPIAVYHKKEAALVSPAYFMFDICDNNINPDYLMLVFKTDIFDHLCWFHTDASVRGGLTWDDFANIEVKIPSIEEQEEIVNKYKTISRRIELLAKNNDILVELIDRVFRQTFGEEIKKINGEQYDNSTIKECWKVDEANNFFDITIGKTPPREVDRYFSKKLTDFKWVSIADMNTKSPFIFDSAEKITKEAMIDTNMKTVSPGSVLLSFKMTVGRVAITEEYVSTNEAIAHFNDCDDKKYYTYLYLKNFNYTSLGSTSAISTAVNSKIIKKMPFLMPPREILDAFNKKVGPIFNELYNIKKEIDLLNKIKNNIR